ncbi:DUF2589 domain-containing protein [Brachyspira hampsonii]|uniref:DUF2589 domain-containing protein n=1 Tax=Brachyspira hampsonii TaxID=1287055 RepID=UPI000D34CBCF|nr:DUF2589 domain-containing protein [Brachyspira hampsonii]PTY41265.1 hypothetical protein DQ06_12395 [Brachyspira hampsonii bv. II]
MDRFKEIITSIEKSVAEAEAHLEEKQLSSILKYSKKDIIKDTKKSSSNKKDISDKYHVEVHTVDEGMPEGLARVLDIINANIAPEKSDGETSEKPEEPSK